MLSALHWVILFFRMKPDATPRGATYQSLPKSPAFAEIDCSGFSNSLLLARNIAAHIPVAAR
jgi:hypothetical protein